MMKSSRSSSMSPSIHAATMVSSSSLKRSRSSSARAIASVAYRSTASLHPVVGTSGGKGRPATPQAENASGWSGGFLRAPAAAAVEAREPTSPRVSSLRAGWHRAVRGLVRVNRRIEDSWVGDLIGVVSLFGLLWIGLVAAAVFE